MKQEIKESTTELVSETKQLAVAAKNSLWVSHIARIGYAVRGLLYGLVGLLALELIFTGRGEFTDQEGAISAIAAQPFGKVILIVITIGLAGLTLWNMISAVADPYGKGSHSMGLLNRAGYLIVSLSYASLMLPTIRLAFGQGKADSSTVKTQKAAAGVFHMPLGQALVATVGIVVAAIGLNIIRGGWKASFSESLQAYQLSPGQKKWSIRMGQVGTIAQGIVMLVCGTLAVLAALTFDPQKVGGIDTALAFLAHQPYGPWLLSVVALGLMAYAVYSFMAALWYQIREL